MAGPRQRSADAHRLQGFPAGVNNVAPDFDAPTDEFGRTTSLRSAVNVDLVGPKKKPRRRDGRTLIAAGRAHSPQALPDQRHIVAVIDGDLRAYDRSLQLAATVRAGVGRSRLSYARVNDDLYWSSASQLRRIRAADLADLPGWVDCPGVPNVEAVEGGNMQPGAYRVAMTWLDEDGRESGCLGLVELDLAAGQCLRIFDIPAAPEGAVTARVYVSPANESELYASADLTTFVTNTIVTSVGDGVTLKTLMLQMLPPCDLLRAWNGRLLGAAGNLLVWSDPLRWGLTSHDNYMRFGERITLLEPVGEGSEGAGLYVADHKNTYWLAGETPGKWRRMVKLDTPAVFGASAVVKASSVGLQGDEMIVVWLGANGVFYAGLPGGQVTPLTEGRLSIPDGDEGAMVFREFKGLRQLIASYIRTTPGSLAVGDRASATVTRYTNP